MLAILCSRSTPDTESFPPNRIVELTEEYGVMMSSLQLYTYFLNSIINANSSVSYRFRNHYREMNGFTKIPWNF